MIRWRRGDAPFRRSRAPGAGDKPDGEVVHCSHPRAPAVSGDIGQAFVEQMRRGTVVEAAKAWLGVFVGGFDPLLGLGGSAWMIERGLTFTVFVTTLYAMPRSKAVGQCGFLVQLLRRFERGGEMQRLFYDAIMTDFATASLPASWSHVVYALLIKPPPSDASIVAEWREIAIMEQLMKVVMQSVRRSVYSHMPRRIVPAQLGWLTGMSTAHVGIQFALAVQQAALTGQSMYLLYCDLSTFFPSIDRAVLRLHELATGVPSQILDIAAAIYNRVVGEAVGTPCRYDSAAGLGDFFVNSMGALMGCVVSPDRAKLFVNSVIAAIELLVRGLRLWRSPASTPEEVWERLGSMAFADD